VWIDLHRQIRVEGRVVQLPEEIADAYFASRPPGSRLAAAASAQSEVVESRAVLDRAYDELAEKHPDGDIPRPSGGEDSGSSPTLRVLAGAPQPLPRSGAIPARRRRMGEGAAGTVSIVSEQDMRLTILGSAGTYPVAGRPGSGYLIDHEGTRVWCDAGPGTLMALPVDVAELDAIFVSHRHPDHCLDVIIAAHVFAFGPRPRFGVPLYGPASALEALVGFVDGGRINEVYDLRPLSDGDRIEIGSLDVEVATSDHSVPTFASRWQSEHRSLCYSADTGPAGDWMRLAKGPICFCARPPIKASREWRSIPTISPPPRRVRSPGRQGPGS
jgi:hypothetical protein